MAKRAKAAVDEGSMKRRTREHVIADLSVNFVERLVLKCGYVVHACSPEYSYDLRLETFDEGGNAEPENVPLQLKATDEIDRYALANEEVFSFPVDAKDYRLWIEEIMPVFLVLYDARAEEAYWVHIQDHDQRRQPELQGNSLRVYVPRSQILGVRTIRIMREAKQRILQTVRGRLE